LVFNNYMNEKNDLPIIPEACLQPGIQVDAVDIGIGTPCYQSETGLPRYDLVFIKARAAIVALAVA
jgi:hypothetical protein